MELIRAEIHQVVEYVTSPALILVWCGITMVLVGLTAGALLPWFIG